VDTAIRCARVVTPSGERPAAVGINDGRIVAVEPVDADLRARRDITLDDGIALLPGLVDTHVHMQDPGHTAWETFDSGTRAAARGGITTLIDMPLDSLPVTVSPAALAVKRAAARGRVHVDVGFWGGVTPWNLGQLEAFGNAGVFGFKCFLADSGLPEFPAIGLPVLRDALRELATFNGLLLVHAEDAEALSGTPAGAGGVYARFLAARPASIEERAVAAVLDAVRSTGGRAHIVHVSSARSAAMIASARADGLRLSAETCPHYLALADTDVADGDTSFKVSPPIRDPANRDALWTHLAAGSLDLIVSDHSPCAAEDKHRGGGDFDRAPAGVSSLQVALPVVWTQARRRGHTLADIARWMSAAPAALAGLTRKGAIEVGRDADLCAFAPDQSFVVDPAELHHRQPVTPYAGRRLDGVVGPTWLAGVPVDFSHPRGRLLHRADP
jgi:allantoinase